MLFGRVKKGSFFDRFLLIDKVFCREGGKVYLIVGLIWSYSICEIELSNSIMEVRI